MDHAPGRRCHCAPVEALESRLLLATGEVARQGHFEGTSAVVAVDWIKGSAWQAGQLGHSNYHGGTGYAYNGTDTGSYIHNTSGAAGSMYQQFTIPAGTSNPILGFWSKITTQETTTTQVRDTMAVQIQNTSGAVLTTLATLSNLDAGSTSGPYTATGRYHLHEYSLAPYVGQTIRVNFQVTTNASAGTMFRVDDVSLAPPSPVVPGTSGQVVGYLPDYRYSLFNQMDLGLLTHINYFSIGFASNGALNQPSSTFNSHVNTVVAAAHARGVGVSITLGPGQPYATMAASATSRERLAGDVKAYLLARNLDGVDVDWEPPARGIDQHNYGLLIDALYDALNPIGKKITAAVNPWTKEIPVNATKKMNWVNIMCYDFDYANHSTYATSTDAMNRWFHYGVAKDKLVMGIPFYGRYGTSWSATTSKTYNTIVNDYKAVNGVDLPVTVNDYVDAAGNRTYFNGVRTTQMKLAFVRDNGFAGAFTWELGQDHWSSSQYTRFSLTPILSSMIRPPAWLSTTTGSLHDLVNGQFIASLGTMTLSADPVSANPALAMWINSGATVKVGATSHIGSLTIDAGGKLDVTNKTLVVDYAGASPLGAWNGSAYTGILGQIKSAAITTSMGGSGLVVGAAEASALMSFTSPSQTRTWNGITVDGSSVIVRRTYNGDANLDGRIDGDDYFILDANYNRSAAAKWHLGDFDLNGRIDGDDYFAIDSSYTAQGGTLSATFAPAAGAALPAGNIFAGDQITDDDEADELLNHAGLVDVL